MSLERNSFMPFGTHVARCVESDVLYVVLHGDILPEHVTQLNKLVTAMPDRERGVFLVVDCTDLGTISASTRKSAANDPNSRWTREVIIVGASFTVRVIVGMMNKAIRAFGISQAPVVFIGSEAEAMAHIARCRTAGPWR